MTKRCRLRHNMEKNLNLKTVPCNAIEVILFHFVTFSTVINNYPISSPEFVAVTSSLYACTGCIFLL